MTDDECTCRLNLSEFSFDQVRALLLAREGATWRLRRWPPTCPCVVCRAHDGDKDAFSEVLAVMFDPDGGP